MITAGRRGEQEERGGGKRWCIQYLAYIQRKMLNELGGKTTLACASFCRESGATTTDVEYLRLTMQRSVDVISARLHFIDLIIA